jgi:hypothetical protein
MNDQPTTTDTNPYRSPSIVGQDAAVRQYASAGQALRAGAWRGAKFGAKWMALIWAVPFVALFVFVCGAILYRTYSYGYNSGFFWSGLEMLGTWILFFVYGTFCAGLACAVGMGLGEVVPYWRSHKRANMSTDS